MLKLFRILVLLPMFLPISVQAAGQIQNENVKSLTDLTAVVTITGNLAASSACISSPSTTVGVKVGFFAYDTTHPTYIPGGTTVVGIGTAPCSAGQIKLSASASNTSSGDTITFGGQKSQLLNTNKMYDQSYGDQLSALILNLGLAGITGAPAGSALTADGAGHATFTFPFGSGSALSGQVLIADGVGGAAFNYITGSNVSSNINLPGNTVSENSLNVLVSSTNASTSLKVIRGAVNHSAVVTLGEGFGVSSCGTGCFTVTFSSAFASTPVIMLSSCSSSPDDCGVAPGISAQFLAYPLSIGTSSFIVHTLQMNVTGISSPTTVNSNTAFSFLAIGPRL